MPEKAGSASPALRQKAPLRLGRLVLEIRQGVSYAEHAVILGGFILLGLSISAVILVVSGVPAKNLANEFILDTLADPKSARNVLQLAAPLAFIGLAAAMAFQSWLLESGTGRPDDLGRHRRRLSIDTPRRAGTQRDFSQCLSPRPRPAHCGYSSRRF